MLEPEQQKEVEGGNSMAKVAKGRAAVAGRGKDRARQIREAFIQSLVGEDLRDVA